MIGFLRGQPINLGMQGKLNCFQSKPVHPRKCPGGEPPGGRAVYPPSPILSTSAGAGERIPLNQGRKTSARITTLSAATSCVTELCLIDSQRFGVPNKPDRRAMLLVHQNNIPSNRAKLRLCECVRSQVLDIVQEVLQTLQRVQLRTTGILSQVGDHSFQIVALFLQLLVVDPLE